MIRRVHVELLCGGDRDLRGELRTLADLDQRVMTPHLHVFRHVAAGLAKNHIRGVVDRLPQTRAHEPGAKKDRGRYRTWRVRGKVRIIDNYPRDHRDPVADQSPTARSESNESRPIPDDYSCRCFPATRHFIREPSLPPLSCWKSNGDGLFSARDLCFPLRPLSGSALLLMHGAFHLLARHGDGTCVKTSSSLAFDFLLLLYGSRRRE